MSFYIDGDINLTSGDEINTQQPQPPSGRFTARLQAASNIAVIALVILVGVLAVQRLRSGPAAASSSEIYQVGETIDPVKGVDFSATQATLVMVIREDCHFCQESLPFYQQLTKARLKHPSPDVRIVVASTDASEALSTYLDTKSIRVDHVSTIEPGALKVPGTPALVLVDRNGKILKLWRGRLAERQQREVFRALGLGEAE